MKERNDRRNAVAGTFCFWLAILPGCLPQPPADIRERDKQSSRVLAQTVSQGPVRLTAEVSPREPRLSDQPTLTVTVEAEAGTRFEMPEIGRSSGDFWVRDIYEPLPLSVGDRDVRQKIYTLEPSHAGSLTIDPVAVRYRSESETETPLMAPLDARVSTGPIFVRVETEIPTEPNPSLSGLRPQIPMFQPAVAGDRTRWVAGAIAAVALALFFLFWFSRPRRRKGPSKPPDEIAREELDELVQRDLSAIDPKEFYVQLTGTVRRFIEGCYGIRAPEQTTTEFLRGIAERADLSSPTKARLQDLLQSADLVKFAGHQADEQQMRGSVHHARAVIDAGSASEQAELNVATPTDREPKL